MSKAAILRLWVGYPEGLGWCMGEAQKGNQTAQRDLALLYFKGVGVVKNEVEGLAWFYVAGAGDDEDVADHLAYYERLYGGEAAVAARSRAAEIQAQVASRVSIGDGQRQAEAPDNKRLLAKARYLKALADPNSGITLDTPAGQIEGTVQNRFARAAQEGVERTSKMTAQELFDQVEANWRWADPERTRKAYGLPPKS